MINALSVILTNHYIRYPAIKGLISQLSQWSHERDNTIAQDIVMTLAMLATSADIFRMNEMQMCSYPTSFIATVIGLPW